MKIIILIAVILHFFLNALRDGYIYRYIIDKFKRFGVTYHFIGSLNELLVITTIVYVYWGLHGLLPALLFLIIRLVIFDPIYNISTGRPIFYVGTTSLYDKLFTWGCTILKLNPEVCMGLIKVVITVLTIIYILPHY